MPKEVTRIGDMSCIDELNILQEDDGDIIVTVGKLEFESEHVQFCCGCGRSPNTMKALRQLMEAMEKDNRENPQ